MSDTSNHEPKPLMTFVFDEVTVLTFKAEPNPQAKIMTLPSKDAPLKGQETRGARSAEQGLLARPEVGEATERAR